jgi:hypothetical protein
VAEGVGFGRRPLFLCHFVTLLRLSQWWGGGCATKEAPLFIRQTTGGEPPRGRLDLFLGDNMMSDPSDFTVKISNDRDIIISKPEAGFKVTYRREVYIRC